MPYIELDRDDFHDAFVNFERKKATCDAKTGGEHEYDEGFEYNGQLHQSCIHCDRSKATAL